MLFSMGWAARNRLLKSAAFGTLSGFAVTSDDDFEPVQPRASTSPPTQVCMASHVLHVLAEEPGVAGRLRSRGAAVHILLLVIA